MKEPILNELNDIRFHNWRFFKDTYTNKCNTCCKKCEHYEECQCRCDFYEETWILGKEFICENCFLKEGE